WPSWWQLQVPIAANVAKGVWRHPNLRNDRRTGPGPLQAVQDHGGNRELALSTRVGAEQEGSPATSRVERPQPNQRPGDPLSRRLTVTRSPPTACVGLRCER